MRVLAFNEPTVAVNPRDPDNLAVADLGFLRVSSDGGQSFGSVWVAELPLDEFEFGGSGDPSLTFDSRGRLFWAFLGKRRDNGQIDIFISQRDPQTGALLPGYPVNVSAAAGVPAIAFHDNDKEWIAADIHPGSDFQDRLYAVWSDFFGPVVEYFSYSDDQGQTWSEALTISRLADGFPWPVHVAVGPEGAVYVAYHAQPGFSGANPDGITGHVVLLRSDDGGATFPTRTTPFLPGEADITFNDQDGPRLLDRNRSWTQGSAQPWVVPDPHRPGHVVVVAADDPSNALHGAGRDDMDVYIARSTDSGQTWEPPRQVDLGPAGTTQFFPTAGVAPDTGCLTVAWWDTRVGATNDEGNFLLDFFIRSSSDGGLSFGPEVRVNDLPFDPDAGAPDRFPPTRTLRIGEYNGVAVTGNTAHLVWTGTFFAGQSTYYDNASVCEPEPLAHCDMDGDGDVDADDIAIIFASRDEPALPGGAGIPTGTA